MRVQTTPTTKISSSTSSSTTIVFAFLFLLKNITWPLHGHGIRWRQIWRRVEGYMSGACVSAGSVPPAPTTNGARTAKASGHGTSSGISVPTK